MSFDPIVRGTDWVGTVRVAPTDGQTNADVTTSLTGATITCELWFAAASVVTGSGAVLDADDREITLILTDVETAALASLGNHQIKGLITESGSEIRAVAIEPNVIRVVDVP
jgi:hypothetical protein